MKGVHTKEENNNVCITKCSYLTQRRLPTLLSVKPTPHCTATPAPHQGRLQEEPTFSGIQFYLNLRPTSYHYPPSHTITSRGLAAIVVFQKNLGSPSILQYVILLKYLLTTPPIILVPNKLDRGMSRTRTSSARPDTQLSNQPFSEHCTNRLSQTRRQPAPSSPSPSHGRVSTLFIFKLAQPQFLAKNGELEIA